MPDLWVDGDEGALPWLSLALTPAVVINTGNIAGDHYQAHYLLDPLLELKAESDRDKAVAYLKALRTVLKGDPAISQHRKLHPHHLRHSFAIHCIKRGMTIERLQKILGHQSPTTTSVYLQYSVADLHEDYDRVWEEDETTETKD